MALKACIAATNFQAATHKQYNELIASLLDKQVKSSWIGHCFKNSIKSLDDADDIFSKVICYFSEPNTYKNYIDKCKSLQKGFKYFKTRSQADKYSLKVNKPLKIQDSGFIVEIPCSKKLEKEQKVFNYNPMGKTWAEKLPCLAKLVKLQFKQEISHFFRGKQRNEKKCDAYWEDFIIDKEIGFEKLDEDNQFSEVGSYKDDPESILINEEQEAGSLLPASIVYFPLRKQYKQPNTEIAA